MSSIFSLLRIIIIPLFTHDQYILTTHQNDSVEKGIGRIALSIVPGGSNDSYISIHQYAPYYGRSTIFILTPDLIETSLTDIPYTIQLSSVNHPLLSSWTSRKITARALRRRFSILPCRAIPLILEWRAMDLLTRAFMLEGRNVSILALTFRPVLLLY